MTKLPLLSCHNLFKSYKEGGTSSDILKDISFNLYPGEFVSIIGQSGSGKSTLLHLLGGLDTPTHGEVVFNDQLLSSLSPSDKARMRNRELGFVYQSHHLLSDFSVIENVAIPLLIDNSSSSVAREKAYNILEEVGIQDRASYFPSDLSGGERQRTAIARALVNNPKLVIADEPTGSLDTKNAVTIFGILEKFNKNYGTTFIVVTHDTHLAKRSPRQLEMRDGRLTRLL